MVKKNIPEFYIILVEPKYSGNIGAVARVMMNFDFKNLYLVNPTDLDDESYIRAVHANKILDNATIFSSFDKAINKIDFLVATSSIESKKDKKHLRNSIILEKFCESVNEIEGKIGLVFGREDYGLYNDEIALCDLMLKIPASENYKALNLSHSVGIVLYSLFIKSYLPKTIRNIGIIEKKKFFEKFNILLDKINYPEHKKDITNVMIKRLMGRSFTSKWEYHTLMGVISRTLDKLNKK
jgi:TrmH family RNA methyltransferase